LKVSTLPFEKFVFFITRERRRKSKVSFTHGKLLSWGSEKFSAGSGSQAVKRDAF